LGPLQYPAFRRLWLCLVVSRLGEQFTRLALVWLVLDLTGSKAALGLITSCLFLPGLVTGPLLGRLLDRCQPRAAVAADNALRALVIGAIPCLYALGALELWHIYLLTLVAGTLTPITRVRVRMLVPQVVPGNELERANTLASVSARLAYLVGPAAAGVLVAATGAGWAVAAGAASFLPMALVALSLSATARAPVPGADGRDRWLGFGVLARMKAVWSTTTLSSAFLLAYGPLVPALPVYSRDTLGAGAEGFGLLYSAYGAGALVGLRVSGLLLAGPRPGVTLALNAAAWGAALAPLVGLSSLEPALLCLAVGGCAWAPYVPIETALNQRLVPRSLQGRVFGARETLTIAATALGPALGGLLLDHLSAPAVIGISSAACVLTGVGGLLSPTLRRLRRDTDPHDG
jgi:MFS transporter, DHA3 family, macrolide efflux protein